MYDEANTLLYEEKNIKMTESGSVSELNQWIEKDVKFKKLVKNVSYIKVIFTDAYNNEVSDKHSAAYATCAEFSTLYTDNDEDDDTVATELILRI